MPKVASEINIVDFNAEVVAQVEEVVEEIVEVPTETVVEPVKPKAKAKGKAKALVVVPEEVPVPEVVEPVEALVPCSKCGKKMKSKTLQYSHKCPMDKVVAEVPVEPVKAVVKEIVRVVAKPVKVEKELVVDYSSIPEEVIQAEISKRASLSKHAKVLKKQESIKQLSRNIA